MLRTDAGQLPRISVVGGPRQADPPRVELRFHARRPSGGEAHLGPSRLELEPSSKEVTCGLPTELSLKIVSDLKQAQQKSIGARSYALVVQAFQIGTTLAASAELELGPFEVFNNATSAVRCKPHAARRTPHAARRNPLTLFTVCFNRREPAIAQLSSSGRQARTRSSKRARGNISVGLGSSKG